MNKKSKVLQVLLGGCVGVLLSSATCASLASGPSTVAMASKEAAQPEPRKKEVPVTPDRPKAAIPSVTAPVPVPVGADARSATMPSVSAPVPVPSSAAKTEIALAKADTSPLIASEMDEDRYEVQAVLTPKESVVVAGLMDGVMIEFPYDNGDLFKKGDLLARFDCRFEEGKLQEVQSRLRASNRQVEALQRLKGKDAVAEVDYFMANEEREQLKALVKQAKARIDLCTIHAPFNGRVTDSMASNHESVKSGRVLMHISSTDALQAELIVPSVWLKWLRKDAPLKVVVHETEKEYAAKVLRIHGQVDPVTRTIQVVSEVFGYSDELLPGMSGNAVFEKPKTNQ